MTTTKRDAAEVGELAARIIDRLRDEFPTAEVEDAILVVELTDASGTGTLALRNARPTAPPSKKAYCGSRSATASAQPKTTRTPSKVSQPNLWPGAAQTARAATPGRSRMPAAQYDPRECATCGKTYKPHRYDQRLCSVACHKDRPRQPSRYVQQVPCASCGLLVMKELKELKRWPKAYCSKACAARSSPPPPPRPHVRKGYEIVGPVPHTIVVAKAYSLLSDRPVPKPRIAGTCTQCGSPYVANGLWPTQSCSLRCTRRAAANRRKHRKRANLKGSARVYRAKVYARDNYACWLCNKPLRMDKQVPHPKAPTLDHVVPVALGGAHTHENIRAAHFLCNSKRGQNAGQLALGW